MVAARRPLGNITRGTTNPNRLRRVDRWVAAQLAPSWLRAGGVTGSPIVVDLGYGASPVTTVEMHHRLRQVRPDVEVVGLEIDPARVAAAQPLTEPGLRFARGGFEVPLPGGRRPVLVRAFNVLRQYDEGEVAAAWASVRRRLADGGVLVDGTCDEVGRRAAWIAVSREQGPVSLTLSWRLAGLQQPSDIAERLPKALIHRNVPGEPVHQYLQSLDDAWRYASPLSAYGARQRFVATIRRVRDQGWPVLDGPARWRLGEVGVRWQVVSSSR